MWTSASLLGLAAAGLAVAGCGSGHPTGAAAKEPDTDRLISSMQAAVRGSRSVHVDGKVFSGGHPVGLDLGVTRQGAFAGSVTQNGVPLQVVGLGDRFYFKATAGALHLLGAPAGACAAVCGKYLETTGPQTRHEVGAVNMATLTSDLTARLPKMTEDGATMVDGQRAWVLTGANGATVDIAVDGAHYPLEVDSAPSKDEVVEFTDWNRVPNPNPPPAHEIYHGPGAP
jgi:hypothetical protein